MLQFKKEICPVCGKEYIPAPCHLYKIPKENKIGKNESLLLWLCFAI